MDAYVLSPPPKGNNSVNCGCGENSMVPLEEASWRASVARWGVPVVSIRWKHSPLTPLCVNSDSLQGQPIHYHLIEKFCLRPHS